ncbi:MAG: transposase [Sedimentisphaerales bacterium]|nr:transposase [Sedimentisphaerales bacterium]
MTNYRRTQFEGGYYFFTVITYKRRKFLTNDNARSCLRQAINETKQKSDFETIAFCLLPNHLHCIWKLPEGDSNYSLRWSRIKTYFTKLYLKSGGIECQQSPSRDIKRERGIWQRRFLEHKIRDEKDLQRHVDYIHYNPLKYELVEQVEDWPWSTYHRYIRENEYQRRGWDEIKKVCEQMDVLE